MSETALDERHIRFYHGRSMASTFHPGDCLFLTSVSVGDIRPGDVIIYRAAPVSRDTGDVVHRVVTVASSGLVTRGDNNPYPDANRVTAANLLGRVTQIERHGKTYAVRGGRLGLLQARLSRARCRAWNLLKALGRRPYGWLRNSGFIVGWWRPAIIILCLSNEKGPCIKYIARGKTVASWYPTMNRFECRKPYDLVIQPSHLPKQFSHAVQDSSAVHAAPHARLKEPPNV